MFKSFNKHNKSNNNPYNFFDKITCINLTTRKDKLDHAIKVFTKLNIPSQFFITKKHKLGGKFGCFHSKYIVVKDAYESGANTFLMFEDDVIDSEEYSLEKIKECINFMKENKDWELFFLGR